MQYMAQLAKPSVAPQVMSMPAKILAVFFDWDMTLVHVLGDKSPSERLTALFERVGLTYSVNDVEAAVKQHQQETGQSHHSHGQTPFQTQHEIAHYYQQILDRLGHYSRNSWQLVNELYDAYSHLPTQIYEDVWPTFDALQEKGITIGVLSNHSAQVRPRIERTLSGYVPPERIIISQEEQLHKPLPEIFHRAAEATAVAPQHCLLVGDNLHTDAIGAVQQGGFARGLWIDRKNNTYSSPLPPRVYRITNLTQALTYV